MDWNVKPGGPARDFNQASHRMLGLKLIAFPRDDPSIFFNSIDAMIHLSVFLDVLHRSGLADAALVEETLEELKATSGEQVSLPKFAKALVRRRLLTEWQVNQLLKGKHRGYLVGGHKILRLLGKGGHASVYLAEHMVLKQQRVIKVISKNRHEGTSMMDRFLLEAQSAARLNHPNIIKCYDIITDSSCAYIVMEYQPGEDLEKRIQRTGPLAIADAVNYTIQAAEGLKHTQLAGLIHRDVKPSNMFLTNRGEVKILDLGLAMVAQTGDEDGSLTQIYDDSLGTADYVSPEQAKNSHSVDHRADMYSLGCTLYHFLVGHAPFHEGSIVQRIAKHQTEMPKSLAKLRTDCPPALEQICFKMMQKNPAHRFQDYDALIASLKAVLVGSAAPQLVGYSAPIDPVFPVDPFASGFDSSSDDSLPLLGIEALDTAPVEHSMQVTWPSGMPQASMPMMGSPTHGGLATGGTPPLNTIDPFAASTSGIPQLGTRPIATQKSISVAEAKRRQAASERAKLMFVAVGILLGIGVCIGTFLIMTSAKELDQQNAPPPAASFEN